MGHARQALHARLQRQRVVTRIVVGHHVATITFQQAQRHVLRAAGSVVKQHDFSIRWPAGLYPHPGLAGRVSIRFFKHLDAGFITVNDRAFQQPLTHQVQQRLEVLAALDDPAGQGLPGDLDAMSGQHTFEAVQRQTIDILGGQQHGQHARAGHAFLDQLCWLVRCDRGGFAATATVDLAHMFDHTDLHRHDVQLLAGFFADDMLAATTGARQLMFWQVMDDFDTWQVSRQWLALATARSRRHRFFIGIIDGRRQLAFRLVEQSQLGRVGLDGLFGLAAEQPSPQ
ncbi:hypothetical protein PS627_04418 [Pseudomonas fluorescens]|nr:hypothetical protein PS627_02755 [Pseudomonas fluorescens]CAG8871383.1 hypothetical protein PS627_04418 [Pseudomonas fluorescens]